jgi:hypothetical protein
MYHGLEKREGKEEKQKGFELDLLKSMHEKSMWFAKKHIEIFSLMWIRGCQAERLKVDLNFWASFLSS